MRGVAYLFLGGINRESKAKISKVSKEWSEQESKNIGTTTIARSL